ncbi:hypothetical protein BH23PLA1_BH23PLA1_25140 [soil metagenome]
MSVASQPIPLKNRALAALLAFLLPGLGHFYQGRIGKGALYGLCILWLYAVGFALGQGYNVYWAWVNPLRDPENFRLYYLGQFWVGLPALPALIQATLIHLGYEPLLHGFMAAPVIDSSMSVAARETLESVANDIRGLHDRFGKLVEIGAIYTTVAGLLNILAIYDAYEGPAHVDDEPTPTAEPASSSKDKDKDANEAEAKG